MNSVETYKYIKKKEIITLSVSFNKLKLLQRKVVVDKEAKVLCMTEFENSLDT